MEALAQTSYTPCNYSTSSSSSSLWLPQAEPSAPQLAPAPAEREHMFNKALTPSDVGKLNRLVIPKQHAVTYFPLRPSLAAKGQALCFEEYCTGKRWCFRYSFWSSSQSYVVTKGWSGFVREKQLDAGDVVSFSRSGRRLFIDWRHCKQPKHRPPLPVARSAADVDQPPQPWGGLLAFAMPSMYDARDCSAESGGRMDTGEPKRLRLFGVNLECFEAVGHVGTQMAP